MCFKRTLESSVGVRRPIPISQMRTTHNRIETKRMKSRPTITIVDKMRVNYRIAPRGKKRSACKFSKVSLGGEGEASEGMRDSMRRKGGEGKGEGKITGVAIKPNDHPVLYPRSNESSIPHLARVSTTVLQHENEKLNISGR